MPDPQVLLNSLKSLLPTQFNEVIFRLEIDKALLSTNVGQSQTAIEVISLLKQSPDGLMRLEDALKNTLQPTSLSASSQPLSSTPTAQHSPNLSALTSEQRKGFRDALIHAFPERGGLEIMIEDTFGKNLNLIAEGKSSYEYIVQALIKWAESHGKLEELLAGAISQNPENPRLQQFSKSL